MRLLVRISNQAGEEGEKGSVEKIQMLKSLQYCITWTDPRQCPLPDQRAGTQCPAWRCTACSPSWPAQQRTAWPGLGRYRVQGGQIESIEWFIKDQGFLARRMNWLLPQPPPLPSLFLSLPVCRRLSLLTGEGGGGPNHTDCEEVWSSIIHIILSRISTGMQPKGKGRRIFKFCSHLLILLKISNIFVPFFAPS